MSRRVVTREAYKALKTSKGQMGMVRCFATTSTHYSSPITLGQGSKKRILKEAKKKDDKLRHAMNIFHLAEWFFPTTTNDTSTTSSLLGPSARANNSKKGVKDSNEKDDLDEKLDNHIRSSIIGNASKYSTQENLEAPVSMQIAYSVEESKLKMDKMQDSDPYNSSAPDQGAQPEVIDRMWPRLRSSTTVEQNQTNPVRTLPPLEDRDAVEKYVANTVKRAAAIASQDRRRPNNMDIRGAQVMDALYGTVAGQFPGLDVLKERVKEREEREGAATADASRSRKET